MGGTITTKIPISIEMRNKLTIFDKLVDKWMRKVKVKVTSL